MRVARQRQGTSYVKLPGTYPAMRCSGRDRLCAELLNDVWVSVTSGSEDYSFKVGPCLGLSQGVCNVLRCAAAGATVLRNEPLNKGGHHSRPAARGT